jgi:hypothetical protein
MFFSNLSIFSASVQVLQLVSWWWAVSPASIVVVGSALGKMECGTRCKEGFPLREVILIYSLYFFNYYLVTFLDLPLYSGLIGVMAVDSLDRYVVLLYCLQPLVFHFSVVISSLKTLKQD